MNENFIDIVRKSLYNSKTEDSPEKMPRISKKIIFTEDNYKSENVFSNKSEKIRSRIATPFKNGKTRKKKNSSNEDDSKDDFISMDTYKIPKRKPPKTVGRGKSMLKRKQLVLTNSSDNKFGNNRDQLSPSKSEIDDIPFFSKCQGNRSNELIILSSDSEDSDAFDMDNFFDSRDHSLNESITDSHSGIDYEFISDYIKDVKITGSKVLENDQDVISLSDDSEVEENETKQNNSLKYCENQIDINQSSDKENETIEIEDDFMPDNNSTDTIEKYEALSDQSFTVPHKIRKISGNENNEAFKMSCDDKYPTYYSNCNSLDRSYEIITDDLVFEPEPEPEPEPELEPLLEPTLLNKDAEYYDVEDSKIIILKENSIIPFYGIFSLKVLHGFVEVLGNILDKTSKLINLYSPRGSALLYLKNNTMNGERMELTQLLPFLNIRSNLRDIIIEEKSAVIKCTKLNNKSITFVEKYISQQIFPKFHNDLPQVIFEPKDNWNIFTPNYSWDPVIGIIEPSTRLLIAGGKGVGKSTFLRYAINKLLMRFSEIRVVDLDPGQPEFFVPGCISVLTITEPIFGPNYTHLKKPDRSYISDINVGHNPSAYIKCVELLMEYVSTLNAIPTVINYMGFSKGIGLKIISSAITHIRPTDLLQIESKSRQKNFASDLTVETIRENCDFFGGDPRKLTFKLHKITSSNDRNNGWTLEPRQAREMCVLAYLGQMMPDNVNSLTSHELVMYEVTLSSIKIMNLQKEEVSPAAVNANLVALCNLEGNSDNFICLGYGVVRGVDLQKGKLVLLTPETVTTLNEVSYIVLGSVSLPPSVYMTPDGITGTIPYVMEGEIISLGQITKRSYLPVNRK